MRPGLGATDTMSVYKGKGRKTYQYDFWYGGVHHKDNTHQTTEADARLVEARIKLELRKQRGGIAEPPPSPTIASWAGVYYTHCVKLQKRTGRPKRLEKIDENLRVVLRFFGRRPSAADDPLQPAPGEEAPFHDLSLRDLIDDPHWLVEFDAWIDRRNVAGSTRNHYLSTMSRLYHTAKLPAYRKTTGVTTENPFDGIPRDRRVARKVALTPALVLEWIGMMSYHARLAVSIAALAPKLRLQNVLALKRDVHIDAAVTHIIVTDHKSDLVTGAPLVVPIAAQLRTILLDAFDRMAPGTTHVVQYRGQPVKSIRRSVQAAAMDAGIRWGRFTDGGITFHTLRHTASTILARLQVNPWLQRDVLGHQDLATTDGYTHLQVEEERAPLEQLSAALPIAAVVTHARQRATRTKTATAAGECVGGLLGGPPLGDREKPEETRSLTRGALMVHGRPFQRKASGKA